MAKQERKDLRPHMRCSCEMIDAKVTNNICAAHMARFQDMRRQELNDTARYVSAGPLGTPKQQLAWVISHPNVTVRAVKPEGFIAYDTSDGLGVLAKALTYQETIRLAGEKLR